MTKDEMRERALETLSEVASGVTRDGSPIAASDRIQASIVLMQLSLDEE